MSTPAPITLAVVDPGSAFARRALSDYFTEIVSRYWGRPGTPAELERALREEPSGDLALPTGLLVIALAGPDPVACAGVRFLAGEVGELTRVYVAASHRRQGLARRIVTQVECRAAEHGRSVMRLDVRSDLIEARTLYARLGYREVAPFNDSPYAGHWFEKQL